MINGQAKPIINKKLEEIKTHPQVLLGSIKNGKHRAARVWYLAKWLDKLGRGRVDQETLKRTLCYLGVKDSHARRWLSESIGEGLLIPAKTKDQVKVFYISSWGKGAYKIDVQKIGIPAGIQLKKLFSKGWRSHVWAAYETTLRSDIPVSQEVKERETGISPRVQRNYLSALGYDARRVAQYSSRGRGGEDKIDGFKTERGIHVFQFGNSLIQRHPNVVVIDPRIAERKVKGRLKKAQAKLNNLIGDSLSIAGRGNSNGKDRVYFASAKAAERALRGADLGTEAFYFGGRAWKQCEI